MTRAMQTAGLTKSDITHINAHATATPIGDTAEANAITRRSASTLRCTRRSRHSVTRSAPSAPSSRSSRCSAIRDGIVPPTLNLDNQDPEIDLDVVHGEARRQEIEYAINNSFGFGGHNVALAFGRA